MSYSSLYLLSCFWPLKLKSGEYEASRSKQFSIVMEMDACLTVWAVWFQLFLLTVVQFSLSLSLSLFSLSPMKRGSHHLPKIKAGKVTRSGQPFPSFSSYERSELFYSQFWDQICGTQKKKQDTVAWVITRPVKSVTLPLSIRISKSGVITSLSLS